MANEESKEEYIDFGVAPYALPKVWYDKLPKVTMD